MNVLWIAGDLTPRRVRMRWTTIVCRRCAISIVHTFDRAASRRSQDLVFLQIVLQRYFFNSVVMTFMVMILVLLSPWLRRRVHVRCWCCCCSRSRYDFQLCQINKKRIFISAFYIDWLDSTFE